MQIGSFNVGYERFPFLMRSRHIRYIVGSDSWLHCCPLAFDYDAVAESLPLKSYGTLIYFFFFFTPCMMIVITLDVI